MGWRMSTDSQQSPEMRVSTQIQSEVVVKVRIYECMHWVNREPKFVFQWHWHIIMHGH